MEFKDFFTRMNKCDECHNNDLLLKSIEGGYEAPSPSNVEISPLHSSATAPSKELTSTQQVRVNV